MRRDVVARYALWSSAAAPVLLIGGWTLAAALQPGPSVQREGYDSLRDTISALAGYGAAHRWVMTLALLGVGACHLATARGLRPLATPARVMLGVGGAATVLAAAFPLPAAGTSGAHQTAATVAFVCLALWPALWRHAGGEPARPPVSVMVPATLVMVALVLGFTAALGAGVLAGLAERLAAGAQAVWPFVTVLLLRRSPRATLIRV
ncbi:DUF998 domain-containing protein [Dactylosporangium sp. NPDC048998]|uniref:DUF998 domain-containing protein n=1 Tax=Dactylosporangium sp. NPDC048998 TaxID=3363976 RepID=UPI00371280AB